MNQEPTGQAVCSANGFTQLPPTGRALGSNRFSTDGEDQMSRTVDRTDRKVEPAVAGAGRGQQALAA